MPVVMRVMPAVSLMQDLHCRCAHKAPSVERLCNECIRRPFSQEMLHKQYCLYL